MSKRRSNLEIVLIVLSGVAEGLHKPTHIMYDANMSWASTQKVLSQLVEQGHLEVEYIKDKGRSNRRYGITEKGLNVIEYFDKASAYNIVF